MTQSNKSYNSYKSGIAKLNTINTINIINIIIWAIILLSFIIAVYLHYFRPNMPAMLASHWNAAGQVDGYMPKALALFLMPVLSVIMLLLLRWLPKIDPLKENIHKFKDQYNMFILVLISFLFYLYLLTVLWNLGVKLNMIPLLVPAFAVLFYCTGILVENTKRNWFIGIRTPWTMSSDLVWDKTNEFGGKAFKIAAYISLLGAVAGNYAIWFVLMPVLLAVILVIVYSYYEYKKHHKH